MRTKKLLKVLALSIGMFAILLMLFVAAFVYNPFEGNLRDMRDIVPRTVDFFVRKVNLAGDFATFPEPVFWKDLQASAPWQELQRGPTVRAMQASGAIERALDETAKAAQDLRQVPVLKPDLLRDFIGTELQVAGNFVPPAVEKATWCAYMRVSWRVRFAWGMIGYGFVQEQMRRQGLAIRPDGRLYVLQPQGSPQPLYAARHLDCLLVGNSKELIERSLALAEGSGEQEAFGTSADYRDGVEERLHQWEQATGVRSANAIEFYLRPDQLFPLVTWDDNWPNPEHPTDMNERVMAAFVNLKGWRFLTGALVFEPRSFSLLAKIDLNRNMHTPFQTHFFKAEDQQRRLWLNPFLDLVPQSACAAAAMRMPAGEFIHKMYEALERDWKEELNRALAKTGQYRAVGELLDKLETALLPRTGFVFRKNDPDKGIPVSDPTVMPQIAWVFWVRPGMRSVLDDFVDKLMRKYSTTFGFQQVYALPVLGKQSDTILEFTNPMIAATGEIAFLVFDEFFLVSNSGPLIRDMINARLEGGVLSVMHNDDLQEYLREAPASLNGFVYAQAKQLRLLIEDYDKAVERSTGSMNPDWATEHRPATEAAVFREKYASRFASISALEGQAKVAFGNDVDARMSELWHKQAGSFVAGDRQKLRQMMALTDLFKSAYVQVVLDPQSIRMSGRAILNY